MSGFFGRVAIGAPVVFLGLILFTGGVENAGMVVFCSVVLTFGLAIAGWLLLCWVVGAAVLGLFGTLGAADARTPHLSSDEMALTQYIRRMEARGMSDDTIVAQLRRNGWSDSEVQKVRGILES